MNTDINKNTYRTHHFQLESSDQFSDLALNWDVSWRQLQKGKFSGDFFSVEDHQAQIYQFAMNRSIEMLGYAPGGEKSISFGFMRKGHYFGTWCDKQVFDDCLIVWGRSGEYEAITPPGFDANVVTLSYQLLSEAALVIGYQHPIDCLLGARLIQLKQSWRINQIRDLLEIVRSSLIRHPASPDKFDYWHEVKFTLAKQIITILVSDHPEKGAAITHKHRILSLQNALDYIKANAEEPITVRELCNIAAVSERTLQYAFQEYFQVSPKAYLKAVRLNGVRKQLRHADPKSTRVCDVANIWGFWHMGQFAADYNAFFSEKPLATLHYLLQD